ncbi:hypothetical protein ACFUIZ_18890 [Streptomyces cinereoruber]|uniref:hypothetical protein n=1 Tax=Streptomyces cinereoruber TaxID=67260 RepID=UPI003628028F
MRITLDLPEYDASDSALNGIDPETGAPNSFPDCDYCGEELSGTAVKLIPFGWLHAEGCLQKAADGLTRIGPRTAWLTVAQHVAKYPSRHSASAIRAVITELLKPAWKLANEAARTA